MATVALVAALGCPYQNSGAQRPKDHPDINSEPCQEELKPSNRRDLSSNWNDCSNYRCKVEDATSFRPRGVSSPGMIDSLEALAISQGEGG